MYMAKLLAALAAICLMAGASAQGRYPDRPIRVIVPVGAGGSTDVITRIVTDRLAVKLGQPVVVENKPGAGGIVGTEFVGKAAPDGYTLLMAYAAFTISPHLVKAAGYDPRAFAPISQVALQPIALVSHPSLPAKSVKEVFEYAKAHPGKLNVGISTAGSSGHVALEQLKLQTGLDATAVIYKSAAANTTAVASNEVQLSLSSASSALALSRSGQVRMIATLTTRRLPQTPDVPTFNEAGIPGISSLVSNGWTGLVAPPGTPKAIVDRLHASMAEVLREPEVLAKLEGAGLTPAASTPAEFQKDIEAEYAEFKTVVERSGMKIQ